MRLTFKGGVHPFEGKEMSKDCRWRNISLRQIWRIHCPSIMVLRRSCGCKGGPRACRQMIAEAGGFVSAPVHASVSGTVKGIEKTSDSYRKYGRFHYSGE